MGASAISCCRYWMIHHQHHQKMFIRQSSARSLVLTCRKMLTQGQHGSSFCRILHQAIQENWRGLVRLCQKCLRSNRNIEMLAVHYYLTFDGSDNVWRYMKTFYREESVFSFLGDTHIGQSDIFGTLSRIRKMMKGNHPRGKIVHLIEKVCSCVHGEEGVVIRVWFIHCEESAPCLWIWVAS